jgi:hypothetical protein
MDRQSQSCALCGSSFGACILLKLHSKHLIDLAFGMCQLRFAGSFPDLIHQPIEARQKIVLWGVRLAVPAGSTIDSMNGF